MCLCGIQWYHTTWLDEMIPWRPFGPHSNEVVCAARVVVVVVVAAVVLELVLVLPLVRALAPELELELELELVHHVARR